MGDTWIVVAGSSAAEGERSFAPRMAEAFWSLGYKVLYLDAGGGEPLGPAGEADQPGPAIVAHLENRGFFVMRACRFPSLFSGYPEFIRKWNCARTSGRAARFLASAGASSVIVCHYGWHLQGLFRDARKTVCNVYECAEDHRNAPGVSGRPFIGKNVARIENKLLARADLTVFSLGELAAARGNKARSAVVIPPGVDLDHFARPLFRDPHARIGITDARNEHPRIGFLGPLSCPSDISMVRAAAAETPGWHWIIAGAPRGSAAQGHANLHFVGPVRYEEAPAWLHHWDVALTALSPGGEYNLRQSSSRLLEYLAAGLPVASTDIPAARDLAERLPGVIFLARDQTAASLVEAVRRALAVPAWRREAGRAFARQHSWQARARRLLAALGQRRQVGDIGQPKLEST